MSWFQILNLSPAEIMNLPRCQWWHKRGWWPADSSLHKDNKVALTNGPNQTILLDLETGDFENLVIAC